MNTQEKIEHLKAARALILVPEHWLKYMLFHKNSVTEQEGFCLIGALIGSFAPSPERAFQFMEGGHERAAATYVYELSETLLPAKGRGAWDYLVDWNNAPEREHQEVLDLLDQAIHRLETTGV